MIEESRRLKARADRDSWSRDPVELVLREMRRKRSDLGAESRFDLTRNAPVGLRSSLAPCTVRGRNPPSFATGVKGPSLFRLQIR